MSTQATERTVRQTVIDRLIDLEPAHAADAPLTWGESVRQLKLSLLRDLEWLLNTRRSPEPAPESSPEVYRSVFNFGLPDVTSMSSESDAVRARLQHYIEETIEIFEPRLMDVRVSIFRPSASAESESRNMKFVVEGLLRMEPNPERVMFDTVLETGSGKFIVGANA